MLTYSYSAFASIAERLRNESNTIGALTLDPNAWLAGFTISDPAQQGQINTKSTQLIRYLDLRAERKRTRQEPDVTQQPSRQSKRV